MDRTNAEKCAKLLEVYLFEYCEVYGIKESALKKELYIVHNKTERILEVKSLEDKKVKMSFHYCIRRGKLKIYLHGEPVTELGNYPKTLGFLETIKTN